MTESEGLKEKRVLNFDDSLTIRVPKIVAKITICGAVTFTIDDTMSFTPPTEEQIKNLHDTFCIDVKLFNEED